VEVWKIKSVPVMINEKIGIKKRERKKSEKKGSDL
jgi:hypothetical protein